MGDKKTDSSKIKKKRMVIEEIDSENEEKDKLEEKVEVVVRDDETSKKLEDLKKQAVANKPKKYTSEEKDNSVMEEETVVDESVERFLDVDISEGLNDEQVNKRIEQKLTNDTNDGKGKSILEIVLSNIFTFFNILYFIIFIALILLQEKQITNYFFVLVVTFNLGIGIYQEIKAKKTVDKMKIMSAPTALVIRNGKKLEIPVSEVVLDDIVMFSSGKQICADCIVLEGNVEVNEALLTGESDAIIKQPGDKLFSGSFLSSGTCVARADHVGKDCFIEKMSADAKKYSPPRSELLKTLKTVIKIISILIFPIIVLYVTAQLGTQFSEWNLEDVRKTLKDSSFIILAMIPSGLFLLTSVALFVGVGRLSKNNTLVQELYCIEMLARVDVLCLDKTGTITDGTMRVCDCVEVNNHTDYTIREIVGSMMNAFEETNPTSEALIKYFDKNNVLTPQEVIPFSSKRKYSAVTFVEEGTFIIGAPDFVIKDQYDKISAKVKRFSEQGCRVLVLGFVSSKLKAEELPKNVKPIAIIVIQDHIREDASDTISFFKQNNVDIKIISGDNPETVSKIADRVGVEHADRWINLNGMTDEEIEEKVFEYTVFGRVTPSQKKLIVKVLKKNGKIVAMTGDGVNDIPALKEADCSIAMASGSEATRYVSHLVLLDSNFSSMPKVVNEGRRVINNIQKTSSLYLTKNLFAMLLAIMYIIIGFSIDKNFTYNRSFPLQASHLFLVETIILGFGTTCLAMQPNTQLVSGKFISNVIKEILPGAITVLLFQIILFYVQQIPANGSLLFPHFADSQSKYFVFETISALVITAVMLMCFIEVCKPFNGFRKIVLSIIIVCILVVLVVPDLSVKFKFMFSNFTGTEWLLLIILLQAAYPVMICVKFILGLLHIIPMDKKMRDLYH